MHAVHHWLMLSPQSYWMPGQSVPLESAGHLSSQVDLLCLMSRGTVPSLSQVSPCLVFDVFPHFLASRSALCHFLVFFFFFSFSAYLPLFSCTFILFPFILCFPFLSQPSKCFHSNFISSHIIFFCFSSLSSHHNYFCHHSGIGALFHPSYWSSHCCALQSSSPFCGHWADLFTQGTLPEPGPDAFILLGF